MQADRQDALLTDLYELTMMQACFRSGMDGTAAFEFFVRKLPPSRNFLVAAGLEPVLDYLRDLRFSGADLEWLSSTGLFSREFIASLRELRFTGDVWAVPEGTIIFPDQPLLRIVAPLRQAQLVESRVINLLHYSTLSASKAARCVLAARGKHLVDFGLRRAHGAEAGMLSARASYLAGFAATATTLAGRRYGIPVSGTMAHSFVQAHEHEAEAFLSMVESSPGGTTLLIDTYDTANGARQVVELARWLHKNGRGGINAVRIDSGDLAAQARMVRELLDSGGCREVKIVVSGNLDEYQLQNLVESGAPIDSFGVGTRMNTSADAPYLDCAYKLVEYAGQARRKTSAGKALLPGRKQVWRQFDQHDAMREDILALQDEPGVGTPLLEMVMHDGAALLPNPPLTQIQAYVRYQLQSLPAALRSLSASAPYPVRVSEKLHALTAEVDRRLQERAQEDQARWSQAEPFGHARAPGA